MRSALAISLAVLATTLLSAVPAQAAQTWSVALYRTNKFLSFTGNITVPPKLPSGGTPYLWPGLEPSNAATVLQPVLDGRGKHWYFGNALVGNPSGPYGGGVNTAPNDNLAFNMTNINGAGNWYISSANGNQFASYTYNIGVQMQAGEYSHEDRSEVASKLVQHPDCTLFISLICSTALFAVELYPGTTWDFGNLVFRNVVITADGTDSRWCTSNIQTVNVKKTIAGVRSSVANNVVTCTIDTLTLSPP